MYQKNILVKDIYELKTKLPEIQGAFCDKEYVGGVINAYVSNIPEKDVKEMLALLKEKFPLFKIIGMSSAAIAFYHDRMESAIALNFKLAGSSNANIFYKEFDRSSTTLVEDARAYAKELREQILAIEDVKAVEIYFAWIKASASDFVNIISEGLEEVPIYGSIANANSRLNMEEYVATNNEDAIVLADGWLGAGVAAAIYSGKELYVYSEYLLGWNPIGRYMDVCTCEVSNQGSTVLWKLDNEKPVDVYRKYLGVEPGIAFVANISEFPLLVERDGVFIARTPSGAGPQGEVYIEGDLLPGEKVRFSYGEVEECLNGTKNGVKRMRAFDPEDLTLIVCGNRFNFLQEDYKLEVNYYGEGRDEAPNLVLGMGEIYRHRGKGGVLNSALVAVGMREGIGDKLSSSLVEINEFNKHEDFIPLAERLAHFLKAMTGELVEAVNAANAANEAKSSFLSNMSHEIRTPINAILGMDEMILRECEDEKIIEYAQNIKTAGNTLVSLVNDILDFSKIEAGKMDIIPVDYDFSSVVNDLVNMIEQRAQAKGLELMFEIDPNIPSILNGDEIRIKQVMTNILTNAVKYTEKGYVKLSISSIKTSEDSVEFNVSVEDTGIGIKSEDISRLSDAFQRVDEERNRNIEGTGLGLNITRRLLELMGSRLRVESEYGKGSRFFFVLRQKVVKWDPIGDYMEAYQRALENRQEYHERFTAPDATVLVVDDTPMNLTVFQGLLKKTKVQIDCAQSGMECLEKTRLKKYDVIFLDHRMPDMDGIETLSRLKDEADNPNKDTVTVSLTANAVSGAREKYIEAGFNDYLTKPIMPDKLETLLVRYLPEEKVQKNMEVIDQSTNLESQKELPEWIKGISSIDIEAGIRNCGGIEELISAVTTFLDSAADNFKAIESHFKKQEHKDFTVKVHALKSSARIIGARELSELAAKLEKAGDEKDIPVISNDAPKLLEMYEALFTRMKELKKGAEDRNPKIPSMSMEEVAEALEAVREMASSYDYDSIRYIIDTISSRGVPGEIAGKIENLKKAVMQADWESINKELEE